MLLNLEPSPTANLPTLADLASVPRGNTQKYVNRDVLTYLVEEEAPRLQRPGLRWLDTPCGEGEFLSLIRRFFAPAELLGADIRRTPPAVPGGLTDYSVTDLNQQFPFEHTGGFDVVSSISGIMCFGNTDQFIARCAQQLRPGGLLLITNDNCCSIRDRLSFLFLGRTRRFKWLYEPGDGIVQLVSQQELKRLFDRHGIRLKKVGYTSFYTEDWLFAPLALLLWPLQWLRLRRLQSATNWKMRQQLFGFRSLLYRHYFFVGEKTA